MSSTIYVSKVEKWGKGIMKNRNLAVLISFIIGINLLGCNIKSEEKKIVLEENVIQEEVEGRKGKVIEANGKVETIDLGLYGEQFFPMYYKNGEIYGYILKESSEKSKSQDYPLEGDAKEYFYRLGYDNFLRDSNKEAVTIRSIPGETEFIHAKGYNPHYPTKITYSMVNYLKEDSVRELPQIKDAIEKIEKEYEYPPHYAWVGYINEKFVCITISSVEAESSFNTFIYDIDEDVIYTNDDGSLKYGEFIYIKSMDTIMYVDKNLNSYKVKLEEGTYSLSIHTNLGKTSEKERFNMQVINDEEILITKWQAVIGGKGGYEITPVEEASGINKYNFNTNKLSTLFEKQENVTVDMHYAGKDVIMLEEFELLEKTVSRQKRYFYKIKDDTMSLILEDDIQDEGETVQPCTTVVANEGGREIFIASNVNKRILKNGTETIDVIYKRYRLE